MCERSSRRTEGERRRRRADRRRVQVGAGDRHRAVAAEQAQAAHAVIRRVLGEICDDGAADRHQYGGSVTQSIDGSSGCPTLTARSSAARASSPTSSRSASLRRRRAARVAARRDGARGGEPQEHAGRVAGVVGARRAAPGVGARFGGGAGTSSRRRGSAFAPQTVGCCALKRAAASSRWRSKSSASTSTRGRSTFASTPEPQRRRGSTTAASTGRRRHVQPVPPRRRGGGNAGLYRLQDGKLSEVLDYSFRMRSASARRHRVLCDTPTRKVYAFYSPTRRCRTAASCTRCRARRRPRRRAGRRRRLPPALSGAGQVARVDPATGETNPVVAPVSSPTSLTFGGDDLATLFITTRGPDGGGLYACECRSGSGAGRAGGSRMIQNFHRDRENASCVDWRGRGGRCEREL